MDTYMAAPVRVGATARDRYSSVAIGLHWLIAAGIAFQILLGWRMQDFEGFSRAVLLQIHKSVGITILLLTVGRLVWRLLNPPPPHASSLTPLERVLSHGVHLAFYAALLALPLTGWALSSVGRPGGMTLFGFAPWPAFPLLSLLPGGVQDSLSDLFDNSHTTLVWVMLALLALHLLGALKHHFLSRDPTLARMAPGARPGFVLEPRLIAIPVIVVALTAAVDLPRPPTAPVRPRPRNLASADVYLDIVGPALEKRCASCHSDDEARGGLSVSSFASLMQGGSSGPVVRPGDPQASELIRRVNLPHDNAKYMPKDGKPPLGVDAIAGIAAWIRIGAPATGRVGALKLSDAQRAALQAAFDTAVGGDAAPTGLPKSEPLPTVPPGDPAAIKALEADNFVVRKVVADSNMLDAGFSGRTPLTDADLANLTKLSPQLLRLDLRRSGLMDASMKTIGQFPHLRVLRLQDVQVTDTGVAQLAGLKDLRELSLVDTKITDGVLGKLGDLPRLSALYVWNTGVTPAALDKFKEAHKAIQVAAGLKPADVPKETKIMTPAN
jgi:cytochrome b561